MFNPRATAKVLDQYKLDSGDEVNYPTDPGLDAA